MTIAEKKNALLTRLSAIKNSQERFAHLIALSRQQPPLESQFKTDTYRVEGCLAKLWFVAEFRDGRCYFRADSESAIVKSVAVLLCDFYNAQAPEEIVSTDPSFFESVGISQHLTQNRRNSLSKIWEKIRSFAEAHIAPEQMAA
ncbi:MAG: SufE family protein [Limisphaerales bacterium]